MMRLVIAGVAVVVAVQMIALATLDRELVLAVTGVALSAVLIAARWRLTHSSNSYAPNGISDAEESLRRWQSRTETLISWSETTRSDWDRRLRPMLARQFELASGRRKVKDPLAFDATGRLLFGDQLWQWVDPDNVSGTGSVEPGPGRNVLDDILQRLEQL